MSDRAARRREQRQVMHQLGRGAAIRAADAFLANPDPVEFFKLCVADAVANGQVVVANGAVLPKEALEALAGHVVALRDVLTALWERSEG